MLFCFVSVFVSFLFFLFFLFSFFLCFRFSGRRLLRTLSIEYSVLKPSISHQGLTRLVAVENTHPGHNEANDSSSDYADGDGVEDLWTADQ